MFDGPQRRWLCFGLLGALALPGLIAAAVGLHVLLDPHHLSHPHARTLAEAASTASHGHSHPAATPEHEHATLPPQRSESRGLGAAAGGTRAGSGPAVIPVPTPERRPVAVWGLWIEGLPPPSPHRLCTLLL